MSAPLPETLGRYHVEHELGRGAMGVVYRAYDPMLDRAVAIKTILLSGDDAERASYEARFLQEAKAAGRLGHPAIITIYDVGRDRDLLYMAMEMLHGVDLRTRIGQSIPTVRDSLTLIAEVAEGLAFAHEHGVVHRDIKPGNIMIVRGGHAKIMDFGIARLQLSDIKTQTGVLLGTPRYMSPEQIAGRVIDQRSDLFSLGGVLYEMLVGRPAFSGSDTAQLMFNIATTPHTAPGRFNRDIPPMLDLIVARALEKDSAARYQSAGELAADLRACLAGLQTPIAAVDTASQSATFKLDSSLHARADTDTEMLSPTVSATQYFSSAPTQLINTGNRTLSGKPDVATVYAVSQHFNSTEALKRLSAPAPKLLTQLSQMPRPLQGLRRFIADPDWLIAASILAAALLVAVASALIHNR